MIFAFLKRDLLIALSYKFKLLTSLIGLFISIFLLYFISRTFQGGMSVYLEKYGGNYFAFALVGISLSSFVSVGLNSLAGEIRRAQVEGTLEALISTPLPVIAILFGNSLWSFLEALLTTVFILSGGILFLKIILSFYSIIIAFFVILLCFLCFLSIGMLSACFIMIFKQGNPINFLFGASSYFLGGVLFPVDVLPDWLKIFSNILPITHASKALRDILLAGLGINEILPELLFLFFLFIIIFPLSIIFFNYSVKHAMKDGSLVQY